VRACFSGHRHAPASPQLTHGYVRRAPKKRTTPVDSFAQNEVILLLHALAYNVMHAARVLMERATGEGWSLLRLRERVLRTAGRALLHARRVVLVIGEAPAKLWRQLWRELQGIRFVVEG